jgi:hypothetical protein
MIPDANGLVMRNRAAAYLSGTSQFTLADAANYWSKGSLDVEIKNAYVYAIWDGTGIVWALAGYSGFNMVPTTTTVTDDDYFLLETGSTYTRSNSHYCVCVGRLRYQYDTGDTPDHTIQATVENAPKIIWNPKSDYGYHKTLATTNTSGSDIAGYSAVSVVVKQAGKYRIDLQAMAGCSDVNMTLITALRCGNATYGSATLVGSVHIMESVASQKQFTKTSYIVHLNNGDTIHLGVAVSGAGGNRILYGDDTTAGCTVLTFQRID